MNKRDKDILEALEKFRVLDRNHLISMFFKELTGTVNACNRVMKRLERDDKVKVHRSTRPYSYYPQKSNIRPNSTKVPHFLAIADFYVQLCKYATPSKFEVEWKTGSKGSIEPDIFMIWNGAPFFVEIQRNHYTKKVMDAKKEKYTSYFYSQAWKEHSDYFPFLWIVSETKYKGLEWDPLRVYQSDTVSTFISKYMKKDKRNAAG
ncbi:replication-relaxation family protein [Halobacillus aidingensis]|uniref:Replication-relaxation n=1 Tax=Halobacillus aidingensis TaxID=240303 RepID=A0A1H0MDZ8_HALAD|nr:replication-relaxation family protein [Halobacillus aidingensis]SDO78496.1 Replication-relaxation [Halobacillus aidingensis]